MKNESCKCGCCGDRDISFNTRRILAIDLHSKLPFPPDPTCGFTLSIPNPSQARTSTSKYKNSRQTGKSSNIRPHLYDPTPHIHCLIPIRRLIPAPHPSAANPLLNHQIFSTTRYPLITPRGPSTASSIVPPRLALYSTTPFCAVSVPLGMAVGSYRGSAVDIFGRTRPSNLWGTSLRLIRWRGLVRRFSPFFSDGLLHWDLVFVVMG